MTEHSAEDGFRAIGLPLLLILTTIFIMFQFYMLSRSIGLQFRSLEMKSKLTLANSAVQLLISIFFYFSNAWNLGLAVQFINIVVIIAVCTQEKTLLKWTFVGLALVTAQLLTGFWTGLDLLNSIADKSACSQWYNTYSKSMCDKGWLAALQFFGVLVIGGMFWSCFTFFLEMIANASGIERTFAPPPPSAPHVPSLSPNVRETTALGSYQNTSPAYQNVSYQSTTPVM